MALDPEALLADLDPEQAEAVRIVRGPLAIHAGAGSGKTRVISRRVAYAAATGAVDPRKVLVVTFTEKAASEMVARLGALGLPGVAARTFHAAALAQLRHFWPSRHGGEAAPEILDSKIPIVGRLGRALPGGYRFTPAKDLADEIEWAKSRMLTPADYAEVTGATDRKPPVPPELFVRLWRDYERAKERAGRLDFDDLLLGTVRLLEEDAEAAADVRRRYAWFSVDEYQDTNPLQQRLLEAWLGDRDDLCVVGDEDQTIYTFTGATAAFLTGFAARHPGARIVGLERNYRSTPEILGLANRLLASEGRRKRLVATLPSGPRPVLRGYADAEGELGALVATVRTLLEGGTAPGEIAVLVRMNAQIPTIEAALTRAAIPFRVRGEGFFARSEVRSAVRLAARVAGDLRGAALVEAWSARVARELGTEPASDERTEGREERERAASLELLRELAGDAVRATPELDAAGLAAVFAGRAAAERSGSADGVNLVTYHRAKGLEWDAVLLPGLEEGTLPIRQAESDEAVAEEQRLLYVGLTRARRFLALTWAERRPGATGGESRRRRSRFLAALEERPVRGAASPGIPGRPRVRVLPGAPIAGAAEPRPGEGELLTALRAWRTAEARDQAVPPYVVAHDALLQAIASERPGSVAALRRVKGMGPARLERYGEALLELVRAAGSDAD